DGNQGDKGCGGYSGDAHCVMACTMLDFALQEGQSADITVMVMEEDGGTTRPWQEIIAIGLQNSGDGRAAAAGEVLGVVTRLGLWANDSDDFIGSFGLTV